MGQSDNERFKLLMGSILGNWLGGMIEERMSRRGAHSSKVRHNMRHYGTIPIFQRNQENMCLREDQKRYTLGKW